MKGDGHDGPLDHAAFVELLVNEGLRAIAARRNQGVPMEIPPEHVSEIALQLDAVTPRWFTQAHNEAVQQIRDKTEDFDEDVHGRG